MQGDVDDVEWEQRLRAVELPTDTLEALVMNYFVVEGHRNAAEAFARESVKAQDFDLKVMPLSTVLVRVQLTYVLVDGQSCGRKECSLKWRHTRGREFVERLESRGVLPIAAAVHAVQP